MVFFCLKQKTGYERRISDWSSDVCSSDLEKRGWLMATDYHGVSAGYRNYVFVILMLMFTLANIDRSILSILVEPIKREYGLSDTQIGTDRKSTRLNSSH